MQMLCAHLVVDADIASLEQAPKTLDAVGMSHALYILAYAVVHHDMMIETA